MNAKVCMFLISLFVVLVALPAVNCGSAGLEITASILVGVGPWGLAYDSGKGEIYVACWGTNTTTVISDSTHKVVATVPVGSRPIDLVYDSGKGTIFVGNTDSSGDGTVSVISDSDHSVIATVTVGGGPRKLAYDANSGKIFVPSGGKVSVISDSTNTLIDTIDQYDGISSAHDSARGISYFSGFKGTKPVVWVVSDTTHEILANITLFERGNSYDIVFDSGTGAAYAVDGIGTVYAVSDLSPPSASPTSNPVFPLSLSSELLALVAVVIVAMVAFAVLAWRSTRRKTVDPQV